MSDVVLERHMRTSEKWYRAKYVQAPVGPCQGSHKVWVDDIMPNISMGLPLTWSVPIIDACYNNDDACKPSVSKTTTLQNFCTAMPTYDYNPYTWPLYDYGSEMQVLSRDRDFLTCRHRAEDVDNSHP